MVIEVGDVIADGYGEEAIVVGEAPRPDPAWFERENDWALTQLGEAERWLFACPLFGVRQLAVWPQSRATRVRRASLADFVVAIDLARDDVVRALASVFPEHVRALVRHHQVSSPHISMALEIVAAPRAGHRVRALCGRFIASYYEMNLRASASKRFPHEDDEPDERDEQTRRLDDERRERADTRLSEYEGLIEAAHRMVRAGGHDRELVEAKLARAVELLDEFRR
jgi:hypothetical protein